MQVFLSPELVQTPEAATTYPAQHLQDQPDPGNMSTSGLRIRQYSADSTLDSLTFLEKSVVNKIQSLRPRLESRDPLHVLPATAFMDDLFGLLRKYGSH